MVENKKVMVEFFCGKGTMAEEFKKAGYEVFKVDNNLALKPDLCIDILNLKIQDLPKKYRTPDVAWFGVPCTKFSIAGSNYNFINFMPTSVDSCIALALVYKCLDLIEELKPKYWFIENPMGYLRKFPFMKLLVLKEAWYCQYEDSKAKPTDFWTNAVSWIPKKCKNENPNCEHERAPRGSKTGTQGLTNAYDRALYPIKLCKEIVNVCENNIKEKQEVLT